MSIKKSKTTRKNDVITILNEYQEEHRTVASERTMYAIKALSKFFDNTHVKNVTIPLCRQYIAFRMDQGVAMSTTARELTTLRAACNHARKWKRITQEEMPIFEIPSNLPKRETWLLKDELSALMSGDGTIVDFIKIAYYTGSRRGAIESLEWSQVNFDRKTISLSKQGEIETSKKRPTVPMGGLESLLRRLYMTKKNEFVLGSDKCRYYEFEKHCISKGLLYVDDVDGRPAGKIVPHTLRHTRATHLLEDGVSIYAVAKLLGDNPTTVQRVYGHISMGSLEDELAKSSFL